MKFFRIAIIALCIPVLASFTAHKFYVSITKIEFAEEEQTLQIISKIFIDDIEDVLQERYDKTLVLGAESEQPKDVLLMNKYVLQKFDVQVNGVPMKYEILGHEYENDILKVYIEIQQVSELNSIMIENKILMDKFEEQQNIIHVKKFKKRKSLVLDKDNPKGTLNFG
ncbi:hypothetical protein POV27_18565 [Aureisphaera galaxeae]|uniref:DUF6702 family protein n=1 Tax=Aureisphaera galaxeae TaxID=1538023 RepID=UPI0023503161|nr:DUF6702 family protein [Aureisphaera galaxeae]MDC8006062.1 hypothetical protein [Aureisphaera galaxeae]